MRLLSRLKWRKLNLSKITDLYRNLIYKNQKDEQKLYSDAREQHEVQMTHVKEINSIEINALNEALS